MSRFNLHKTLLRLAARAVAAFVCLNAGIDAMAQTDAQLTQYWAMPTYYNAGAVGNSDFIRVTAASRLQWVGIPKAPKSFIGLADSPFKVFGKRVGAGAAIMQESAGLYSSLNASLQAAYKLKVIKGELSIGLQFGLISETFKGSET